MDLIVVHHLKKNQRAKKPDLDDLAWAGFAEWADSWILLCHMRQPNAGAGHFAIGVVAGSRQGFELIYEIEGDTGGFNIGRVEPRGELTWSVQPVSSEDTYAWGSSGRIRKSQGRQDILSLVEEHPFQFTKSQLAQALAGNEKSHRENIETMIQDGVLETRRLQREEGAGRKTRDLVGRPTDDSPARITNIGRQGD